MKKVNKTGVFAAVLAGGSGTRLWPLSRSTWPKQLLHLTGNLTLLQETCRRTSEVIPLENQIVITNQDYYHAVLGQMQEIFSDPHPTVISEPCMRNTAPAILWAAQIVQEKSGDDSILVVLPSDHLITQEKAYESDLRIAIELAREGRLVTFGIKPSSPETGFGYIEAIEMTECKRGFFIRRFIEKPDQKKAEELIRSGHFFWNSGMFVFHVRTLMNEIKRTCPELYQLFHKLPANDQQAVREAFSNAPSISIDYALMEKTEQACMVPASFGWSDVGSWQKLFEISPKDTQGNVVIGDHVTIATQNCLIFGQDRTIATLGIKEMAVVDTPDALLVCPLSESQNVREIVARLKAEKRRQYSEHTTIHRPWGSYTLLEEGPRYKIKRIIVKPGKRLSLQRHTHRSEHWVVVSGTALISDGQKEMFLCENQSTFIPPTHKHRLANPGRIPLQIIEIQVGAYLEEDDIERFDDDFNRI